MILSNTDRRLLVALAFAGINHGYRQQVYAMLPALPFLIPNKSLRSICHALLLLGLDEITAAKKKLEKVTGLEQELEKLKVIFQYHKDYLRGHR